MTAPEPDRGALAFAEKLLSLLDEGRVATTYKYAVLLGLIDLCLEHSTISGSAPPAVRTEQLAEKVLELYWPHTAPYGDAAETLHQSGTGKAELISLIQHFRNRRAPDPSATLFRARTADTASYERLIREVEWKLIEMPLPRLQIVGRQLDPFLYEISWDTNVKRRDLSTPGFDRSIRFPGCAGEHLLRLAGLLRPLVQRHWTRLVARFNADLIPDARLEEFLFGAMRISLEPVRQGLSELQDGRCFYCGGSLGRGSQVDHFVPWARYANDGLENLVASDGACNAAKSDHLAATEHVERWLDRLRARKDDLAQLADRARWARDPERGLAVARSIYLRLPPEGRLWAGRGGFVPVDRPRLIRAFEAA